MVSFCLLWGARSGRLMEGFVTETGLPRTNGLVLRGAADASVHGHLALPLMVIRTNSRIRIPKWLSYAVYPGHLLICG